VKRAGICELNYLHCRSEFPILLMRNCYHAVSGPISLRAIPSPNPRLPPVTIALSIVA
jgi:hypothetical protein